MKITPAQVTLNALRDGQVMNELAQHIHDAVVAVEEHHKGASVTLTMEFKPLGTKGVSDAFEIIGEVTSKLPKPPTPSTLFFSDEDGNPSRTRRNQEELPGVTLAIRPSAAA